MFLDHTHHLREEASRGNWLTVELLALIRIFPTNARNRPLDDRHRKSNLCWLACLPKNYGGIVFNHALGSTIVSHEDDDRIIGKLLSI